MSPRKKLCQPAVFGLPSAPCVESDQFQSPGTSFVLWRLRGVYLKRKFFLKKKKSESHNYVLRLTDTGKVSPECEAKIRTSILSVCKGFSFLLLLNHDLGAGVGGAFEAISTSPPGAFPQLPLLLRLSFPVAWSISAKIFKACGIVIKRAPCSPTSAQDKTVVQGPFQEARWGVKSVLRNDEWF